jgi:hypothetical protein
MQNANLVRATSLLLLLSAAGSALALLPEPGNVYYGRALDVQGNTLEPNSHVLGYPKDPSDPAPQVILVRGTGTGEVTIAQAEVFAPRADAPDVNYILRPSIDDGLGARYDEAAGRSNEVVSMFIVQGPYRIPVTNAPGCVVLSDQVPRLGGRAQIQKVNVRPFDDSDGDCLADSWEIQFFGALDYNGDDDVDADGSSNAAEFMIGSNPMDDQSTPATLALRITQAMSTTNGSGRVGFAPAKHGFVYMLESSDEPGGPYMPVSTNLYGDAGFSLPNPILISNRFMRVRQR